MYGRIVRSKRETPYRLADSDRRRFVMITGPSGLRRIRGKDGFQAMIELGHSPDAIKRELAHGMRFSLVTFERPAKLHNATWQGVIDAACEHYPDFEDALRAALPDLRSKTLAEFEAQMRGISFSEVHAGGPCHACFLTPARFRASAQTSADVRLFLFNELHLNELFTGDGRTLTHTGRQGVVEYVTPNVDIASLRNLKIRPIEVNVP
jgi:hypothetical protein